MFFHHIFSRVSNYFKKRNDTNDESGVYNFDQIQQAIDEMGKHQENLEDILYLIKESSFNQNDEVNVSKTIECLQKLINENEHRIQKKQKQAIEYKAQNNTDKSKKCIRKKKDLHKINESIINTVLFLENIKSQLEVTKSISALSLHYDQPNSENNNNESDNDENSNDKIKDRENFFENIMHIIINTHFFQNDVQKITDSINNLLVNLDEKDQRFRQEQHYSIEYKQQKMISQANNHLEISQSLKKNSDEIIQLISILQKKLLLLQIEQIISQLPIEHISSSEFSDIQTSESELNGFFDQINDEILSTEFHSKDDKKLTNSIGQLQEILDLNEKRVQIESQKISEFKKVKEIQLAKNHLKLKKIFQANRENMKQILENIEFQLENFKQNKMASKIIKKFSKKNLDENIENSDEDFDAQIDEFNDLKEEFDQIDDALNFNLETNADSDSDFD